MADKKKMFIMVTHGPENPELSTIPFVMANAALVSGIEVVMGFQANGVILVKKGCAEHVFAANFPSLSELMQTFIELGGKLYVCGPCVKSRKIDDKDFVKDAKVVNAPTFINEIMTADQTLVY